MEKDENLKIVRITDPMGGQVHHSFHQLPLTSSSSNHNTLDKNGNPQSKSMMDIRFIDNGIDVTSSIKRSKAFLDENMILGEKLLHPKRYNRVGCSKEDTMKEIMETPCIECRRKSTPFHKQIGVSFEGDDDLDDKTTASLNSGIKVPKEPPPGPIKQFFIDLKRVPEEFSCKRDDTIEGG